MPRSDARPCSDRPGVDIVLLIPFAGSLSDRIGRKPCWWISLGGLFVLAVPMLC